MWKTQGWAWSFLVCGSCYHLPDTRQAKRWDAEVCGRERADSRQPTKELIHKTAKQADRRRNLRSTSLKVKGVRYLYIKKWGCLRPGARWWEVEKRWVISICAGVWVTCYFMGCMFKNGGTLARSVGGEFGLLTSKSHSSDNCAGPVLGSVVPTCFRQPD